MKRYLLAAPFLALSAFAGQAATVDTVDVSDSFANNYFVPDAGSTYSSPYYRWNGDDWGWTHSAISGAFSTAKLAISAFDVDYLQGEVDEIWALDSGVWTLVGSLEGVNDQYSYTEFVLGNNFFDDIAAGLQVLIKIDTGDDGWAVTLAKSVLSLDGGKLPNPNPGVPEVPLPAGIPLIGSALAAFAALRLRRKSA